MQVLTTIELVSLSINDFIKKIRPNGTPIYLLSDLCVSSKEFSAQVALFGCILKLAIAMERIDRLCEISERVFRAPVFILNFVRFPGFSSVFTVYNRFSLLRHILIFIKISFRL